LELVVLYDLGLTFVFTESIELPVDDVVRVLAKKFTWNIRVK